MNTITKPIPIPNNSNPRKNILETNFNGPIDFSPPNEFMMKINQRMRIQEYKNSEIENKKQKSKSIPSSVLRK